MTQKFTISELLKKHMNVAPYGEIQNMARAVGVGRQRLYEWKSGKIIPREKSKLTVVDYLKSKKAIPQDIEVL